MAHLLDANVFIRAKNEHFGFDFCPAFWDWLAVENAGGLVFSIEEVGGELRVGDDELSEWAAQQVDGFFLPPVAGLSAALERISRWLRNQGYKPAGIDDFLQAADCGLIAHALVGEHDVVTHELSSRSTRRVKISNVCEGFGIGCLTPFEMLRREGARFVLGASA